MEDNVSDKTTNATPDPRATPDAGDTVATGQNGEKEDLELNMESRTKEAESKAAEYLDQLRRIAAEFANYRKRMEREQTETSQRAIGSLLARVLPVLDDFERAEQNIPGEIRDGAWMQGITLIERKLRTILEQEGVQPIETVGKPFDPTLHEALMQEDTTEQPDGYVVAELQKGYRMGDRIIRPALVKMARNPSA
ncbi:MAG: nucleotide exchange factor GrpE [Chloroflexi bacterium]|nr:nucleotide exchange factor GrpE [Chloroflexota bacterium]